MRLIIILSIYVLFQSTSYARHNSVHPLSEAEWHEVMDKVALLDNSALMPSLLPIIMANRDVLRLSDDQVTQFRKWRKDNYARMVYLMDEIIRTRIHRITATL